MQVNSQAVRSVRLAASLALLSAASTLAQAVPLPQLSTNINDTSVSGLSAGGFMAVQFHVAYSQIVKGAGVIAGGPYFCANDDQNTATSVCSCTGFLGCQPNQASQMVPDLVRITNQRAQLGSIDETSNLANSKVWLFSGSADSVVPTPVMSALQTYYQNYIAAANISFQTDIPAEHAMPTDNFGNACSFRGDPFINNCNFDAAGVLLKWLYGNLNAKNTGFLGGRFIEFDQSEFLPDPTSHGMSSTGWAYVPAACEQNTTCKVHVVFHGCKQYPDSPLSSGPHGKFGDTYVKHAGYNSWADTNNIVILYPQANAMTINTRLPRSNPNGCWDWWGYDDGSYAIKAGHQMSAVKKMLDRLAGARGSTPPPPPSPPPSTLFCGSATNIEHATQGRASAFFWWYFARGTNDFLGLGGTQTTLQETSPGKFTQVSGCP